MGECKVQDPSEDLTSSSSSSSKYESNKSQGKTSSYSSDHKKAWLHQWQRRSRTSHKKEKSTLKPIPPKVYDGSADAQAYHWFIQESEAYLRDGWVRGTQWRVFTLSRFLENKSYNFYTQKVAINEWEWPLPCFFKELFNYCFLIDYWMQTRKRLAHCLQGERTITEYSHELQELFNTIGTISERDQVLQFWNGVKPEIPEIIEISENIAHKWENRAEVPSSHQDILPMPRFSVHQHYLPASQIWSLRSMTFESSWHRDWSARAPSTTNQSRTPARSLRFHQSQSLRSTLGHTGDNDRTPNQTRHLRIKTEPWGDTPVPPMLSEKKKLS